MINKALITAASNKFFPSLINLLGSIKQNYPNHPKIFVYDLGLFWTFRKELEQIENVEVLDMPHFVPFWRSCYTWKTYIFAHPVADLNFYMDAGCQVLRPLDKIFIKIEDKGYFVIPQGVSLKQITPEDYWDSLNLPRDYQKTEAIHAGEFGFKAESEITEVLNESYNWALKGLALGFSAKDQWRSKGYDKISIVRNCEIFRHDMTLLNIAFRKKFGSNFIMQNGMVYAGGLNAHPDQVIWNLRLGFKKLEYLKPVFLHSNFSFIVLCNRIIIGAVIGIKNLNLFVKKRLGILSGN